MKLESYINDRKPSEGYVVTLADRETDQPLTEEVVSDLMPTHKAAMSFVRNYAGKRLLRIQPIGKTAKKEYALHNHRLLSQTSLWQALMMQAPGEF